MPGEQLLGEAAQNFRGAGETAIASENAATNKESVRQEPGLQAGRQINEQILKAQGDKAQMKLVQEQSAADIKLQLLKNKAGEIEIPPEVAIQWAKEFKNPSMFQFAGKSMNVRAFGYLMSNEYKKKMAAMKPYFDGNMMITYDEDGNPVKTDLTKFGYFYRPTGGKGGSGAHDKTTLEADKIFLKEFNDRKKALAGDAGVVMKRKDPERYDRESAWIEDNEPKADEIMRQVGPGGSSASSKETPKDPTDINSDLDSFFEGTSDDQRGSL